MALRKPTFIRWTEEAEAHHILEWAGLDSGSRDGPPRPSQSDPAPRLYRWPARLVYRLRTILGRRTTRIARDGGWLDSLS